MRRLTAMLVITLLVTVLAAPGMAAPGPAPDQLRAELTELHHRLMSAPDAAAAQAVNAGMENLIRRLESNPQVSADMAAVQAEVQARVDEKLAHDLANNERTNGEISVSSTVNWGLLWRGDIMHVNNKKFFNLYAMYYSHSGTYDGSNLVYESNEDGVRLRPLSNWQQGQPIALGYNNRRSFSQRTAALDWAKSRYGTNGSTPYNWNYLDKNTDSSLYCSQLVWKINLWLGDDVDSNDSGYAWFLYLRYGLTGLTFAYYAVAPDEIFLSPLVTYFSVGTG